MRPALALLTLAALGASLAGCVAEGPHGPARTAGSRGYDIFERQCAGCHSALGPMSPTGAPPFVELGRRYNALSFERRLQEIAAGRHDLMPAFQLSPDEASDLAAYISGLPVRPAPCNIAPKGAACSR